MKKKTISVAAYLSDYEKFKAIRQSRPEDENNADTFAYLIHNFEAPIA
jgi:hypothetical protein